MIQCSVFCVNTSFLIQTRLASKATFEHQKPALSARCGSVIIKDMLAITSCRAGDVLPVINISATTVWALGGTEWIGWAVQMVAICTATIIVLVPFVRIVVLELRVIIAISLTKVEGAVEHVILCLFEIATQFNSSWASL
mmetsp:Transcript_11528/g.11169  ORF Transcript_11528/g.11169 Transcript_11528/m.11169 type:complete len:140 (+) Transcript_11528:229-648(+)